MLREEDYTLGDDIDLRLRLFAMPMAVSAFDFTDSQCLIEYRAPPSLSKFESLLSMPAANFRPFVVIMLFVSSAAATIFIAPMARTICYRRAAQMKSAVDAEHDCIAGLRGCMSIETRAAYHLILPGRPDARHSATIPTPRRPIARRYLLILLPLVPFSCLTIISVPPPEFKF